MTDCFLVEPSVVSVGHSYDNAWPRTVIRLFKTEVIHRRGPWRSLEAVELAALERVVWFNNRRLLSPSDTSSLEVLRRRVESTQSAELAMVA